MISSALEYYTELSPAALQRMIELGVRLGEVQLQPFSLIYRTARRNLGLFERGARIVRITGRLGALCREHDDIGVLDTAIAARANFW